MDPAAPPLLTDLCQLNMAEAYLANRMTETGVFEFFSRRLAEVADGYLKGDTAAP